MASPQTSSVVRDINSVPIPQGWNPNNAAFEQIDSQNGQLYATTHPDPTGVFAFPTDYGSVALEKTNVIKNSPGVLNKVFITNTAGSSVYYFQLFNNTAVPSNGNVPTMSIIIPNGVTTIIELGINGKKFSAGISFGVSTTPATYTAAGSNLFLVYALGA